MSSPTPRLNRTHETDPQAICSLPPDELEARISWIREQIGPHTVATERLEEGLAFELEDAPGLADTLARLIRLENECCPGVTIEVTESAHPGRLRLELGGVDPDSPLFGRIRRAGAGRTASRRAATAAAAGLATSLSLCCLAPAAGAALGVGSASLLALDAPLPVTIVAVISGGAVWWRLGRWRLGRRSRRCGEGGTCCDRE